MGSKPTEYWAEMDGETLYQGTADENQDPRPPTLSYLLLLRHAVVGAYDEAGVGGHENSAADP